jgi:hypothetical protein
VDRLQVHQVNNLVDWPLLLHSMGIGRLLNNKSVKGVTMEGDKKDQLLFHYSLLSIWVTLH